MTVPLKRSTRSNLGSKRGVVDHRVAVLCACAVGLAVLMGFVARALVMLIGFVTNLAYYGRFSLASVSPAGTTWGPWAVAVPVVGGLVVGLMARYGSKAIRGHGIPEAMDQVLTNESRIHHRVAWLKPLSAAVAIGTGGPFGAEGPIIATGGALGSLLGQRFGFTPHERKVLLASGAAAGMAAIFGSPVSATLLAVELLLFEFHPRSVIPVAIAAVVAEAMHLLLMGPGAAFPMPTLDLPGARALAVYLLLGAVVGWASVGVTKAVYAVEDAFERLPIHWMWWPALGGVFVGLIGLLGPLTLGVGYDNIQHMISGDFALKAALVLCSLKFISWAVALGTGTSGGTLAPLLTLGSGLGFLLASGAAWLFPHAGVDPRMGALVGMAAMFTGAARSFLASVVFGFETTLQASGLLPLLGGCASAYLVSCLVMKNTLMTEKIARRGVKVPVGYVAHQHG